MLGTSLPQIPPPSATAPRLIERIERGKRQLRELRPDEPAALRLLTGPELLNDELNEKIRAILAQ